jgi:hypothetical protein
MLVVVIHIVYLSSGSHHRCLNNTGTTSTGDDLLCQAGRWGQGRPCRECLAVLPFLPNPHNSNLLGRTISRAPECGPGSRRSALLRYFKQDRIGPVVITPPSHTESCAVYSYTSLGFLVGPLSTLVVAAITRALLHHVGKPCACFTVARTSSHINP